MTHVLCCDFCHEPIIAPREPYAHLSVTGTHHDDGPLIEAYRDYHAGVRGDGASCLARALRLLDGGAIVESGLATGWDRGTPLVELDLPTRVVRTLRGAGVETVAQLADLHALGALDAVRGIGTQARARIESVLEGVNGA